VIQIKLNDDVIKIKKENNLEKLIVENNYETDAIAVAVNQIFIQKNHRIHTVLKENDQVDVVKPMAGG